MRHTVADVARSVSLLITTVIHAEPICGHMVGRTDQTIYQTLTVTSEHIRFYFLVFLFYTFSCRFCAVD